MAGLFISRPSFSDRRQNLRHHLIFGFRPEIALAVSADGDVAGFHVASPDDEHGVNFGLLGADFVARAWYGRVPHRHFSRN